MKYKIGDKVRVKSLEWYNDNKDEYGYVECGYKYFTKNMRKYCGNVVTISSLYYSSFYNLTTYNIAEEDDYSHAWSDDMFEGLAEEGIYDEEFVNAINTAYNACLDDYNEETMEERNEKSVNHVFDTEVISFDIAQRDKYELDLQGKFHVVLREGKYYVERIKPQYPKTYEECRKVLGIEEEMIVHGGWYKHSFIRDFYKLLICRDAYWKIAGNWKPDYENINQEKWGTARGFSLPFPTKEILDTFNENFEDLVKKCENYYERDNV